VVRFVCRRIVGRRLTRDLALQRQVIVGQAVAVNIGFLSIVVLSVATAAHAQDMATSFFELQSHLSTGDAVLVTTGEGRTIKARVRRLSDTVLVLQHDQDTVTLSPEDVQRRTPKTQPL
jgi:hypothetical protein